MINTPLYFFVVILTSCLGENLHEDWIDPYDMSPSKDYLQFSDSISSLHAHFTDKNKDKPSCDTRNTLSDIYFRRTINMLLNSVHEDFIEQDLYSGHLFFKIDAEKYAILKSFADGVVTTDLEKIDDILADIFNKPTHKHLQEYLESWFHKCLNVILSREGVVTIIITAYVFAIFKLFHANLYSMRIVKFLLINFLLFDFIFTWVHLYQQAQGEDLSNKIKYKDVPVECDPSNMNTWQFVANIFTKEDTCKKYYQIKYQDIFYKVTPGTVLTEMFTRTIQYPAKSIGRAFGEMSYGIYDSFPWPLNIIILPIGLIFLFLLTCILVCISFSMILSKPMKFNFLYLISFSFGGESVQTQNGDMISGSNLKRLLNMTQNQRQFIEEIPIQRETIFEQSKKEVLKKIEEKTTIKNENKVENNNGNNKKQQGEQNNDENMEIKTVGEPDNASELGSGDAK